MGVLIVIWGCVDSRLSGSFGSDGWRRVHVWKEG